MSRFVSVAGEQVAELASGAAEDGRLSRGRALFRKGSVSDLTVTEGSVIASVRGSQGDVYETTVGTALAPPGVVRQIGQAHDPDNRRSIDDLIADGVDICPREVDLAFGCDCGDWDELCKHVVAVILALADRVDLDEAELLRWRGVDLSASPQEADASTETPPARRPQPDPTPGNRSVPRRAAPANTPTNETEQPPEQDAEHDADRSATLSELEALLGDTVMRVSADERSDDQPSAPLLAPAMADFLGVELTLDLPALDEIPTPAPLFTEVQLGPLADLGPELHTAMAVIASALDDADAR